MRAFLVWCLLLPALADDMVHNDGLPDNPKTVIFTEDLRISPESGEEYHLWSGNVAVEINHKGHLFVVDPGGSRIIEFDSQGRFVRQIGREGQGPDEFQGLKSLVFLEDGNAITFESNNNFTTFTYWDADMKVSKVVVNELHPVLLAPVFSPDGRHIGSTFVDQQGNSIKLKVMTGLLTSEKKVLMTLSEAQQGKFNMERAQDTEWWVDFLAGWFKIGADSTGLAVFGPDGDLYTAVTGKYEITRWDAALNKEIVIRRGYQPIPRSEAEIQALVAPIREEVLAMMPAFLQEMVTESVIRRAVEKAEFSFRKPPIFGILPMEKGFFLVIHDYNALTRKSVADLFAPSGKLVGRATLPRIAVNTFGGFFGVSARMTFKNGMAYAAIPDQDGEYSVARYRYELK